MYSIPVLKHSILTWFPIAGSASASSVGAKNMASSSGCAMSRQMRLLRIFWKVGVREIWAV